MAGGLQAGFEFREIGRTTTVTVGRSASKGEKTGEGSLAQNPGGEWEEV